MVTISGQKRSSSSCSSSSSLSSSAARTGHHIYIYIHTRALTETLVPAHTHTHLLKRMFLCVEAPSSADSAALLMRSVVPGTKSAFAATRAYLWYCGTVHVNDLVGFDTDEGFQVGRAKGFLQAEGPAGSVSRFVQAEALESLRNGRWRATSQECVLVPLENVVATLIWAPGDGDNIVVVLPLGFGE